MFLLFYYYVIIILLLLLVSVESASQSSKLGASFKRCAKIHVMKNNEN